MDGACESRASQTEGRGQWRSNLIEEISAFYITDDSTGEHRAGCCTSPGRVDGHVDLVEGLIRDISVFIFYRPTVTEFHRANKNPRPQIQPLYTKYYHTEY